MANDCVIYLFKHVFSFRSGDEDVAEKGECSKDQVCPLSSRQDFVEKLKKQRRQSQGFANEDIINSDEEPMEKNEYIKEKMQQQRRKSQGYCQGSNSSLEDLAEIVIE